MEFGRRFHQRPNFTALDRPVRTGGYTSLRFEADTSAGRAKRVIARAFARVVAEGFKPVGFHIYGKARDTEVDGHEIEYEWAEACLNGEITMREYT